ncbi:MAG: hypothetical protein KKD25_03730 [Gammaproteobacteria bacterium]|uniref:Putative capsid protein n=1 Tax=viral metagenome TaxID=1070528 RepID=A0A6M3MCD1_9ZZZZ|nr:hypothetical protein [Gammaproteobacteria bacterium]MBU0770969.1 hypothetical protein [Gammaproteobacteria bacterium]MBU0856715.1 hypothetical protein [Gammaproteobacteria bacterium]MBU1848072.1 hypothetical protein [Gammaproteobacteria bacterium]
MICVEQNGEGVLVATNPQPADVSACGMVVPSGQAVVGNPFALSVEDGAAVSAAIIGVWAVAYVFRIVIQSVKGSTHEESPS